MGSIRQRLGENLRRIRTRIGLTQEDLAAASRMDAKYLGEVERGNETISVDRLGRIADALGIDAQDLFLPLGHRSETRTDGLDQRVARIIRKVRVDRQRLMEKILRLIAEA